MPHTSTAKKRHRQDEKRNARNRAAKKAIKTQIKKVLETVKDGSPEQLTTEFTAAVRKLDKAAAKKVIHPNMAARKKSQLAKLVQTKKPAPAKTA
jgi:small subunit ribosomal protein S20